MRSFRISTYAVHRFSVSVSLFLLPRMSVSLPNGIKNSENCGNSLLSQVFSALEYDSQAEGPVSERSSPFLIISLVWIVLNVCFHSNNYYLIIGLKSTSVKCLPGRSFRSHCPLRQRYPRGITGAPPGVPAMVSVVISRPACGSPRGSPPWARRRRSRRSSRRHWRPGGRRRWPWRWR